MSRADGVRSTTLSTTMPKHVGSRTEAYRRRQPPEVPLAMTSSAAFAEGPPADVDGVPTQPWPVGTLLYNMVQNQRCCLASVLPPLARAGVPQVRGHQTPRLNAGDGCPINSLPCGSEIRHFASGKRLPEAAPQRDKCHAALKILAAAAAARAEYFDVEEDAFWENDGPQEPRKTVKPRRRRRASRKATGPNYP